MKRLPHWSWVLFATCAALCASIGLTVFLPYQQEQRVIEWVERVGGDTSLGTIGPEWLRQLTDDLPWDGFRVFDRVVGVSLSGPQFTDDEVALLTDFKHLDWLSLTDTEITDEALRHVKAWDELDSISLHGSKITDAGLEYLRERINIRGLSLDRTSITDAGLAHLSGLSQLSLLSLSETRTSDAGLVHVSSLTKLESLYLGGPAITDQGLAHLRGLKHLTRLALLDTSVSDEGLTHLSKLTSLEELAICPGEQSAKTVSGPGFADLARLTKLTFLNLRGTAVGDTGVPHLSGLGNLKTLWLDETPMTAQGIEALKAALPGCKVDR